VAQSDLFSLYQTSVEDVISEVEGQNTLDLSDYKREIFK